jgi:hypothetical protein
MSVDSGQLACELDLNNYVQLLLHILEAEQTVMFFVTN